MVTVNFLAAPYTAFAVAYLADTVSGHYPPQRAWAFPFRIRHYAKLCLGSRVWLHWSTNVARAGLALLLN